MRRPKTIAILASYPPPYGGVANHVQRLSALLCQRGVSHVVYNLVSDSEAPPTVQSVAKHRTGWLLTYALLGRDRLWYVFSDRLSVWAFVALAAKLRRKSVVVRLRNSALPDWMVYSPWRAKLAGLALRQCDAVVCVSPRLVECARAVGVPDSTIFSSPGFLPPLSSHLDDGSIAPEVSDFMSKRRPLIAANGKVAWYRGSDLYGLDMLVDLCIQLKPTFDNLGVVVCFWDHAPKDDAYLEELRKRAERHGVANCILFNTKSGAFIPVLSKADLFVRPTATDGDANSIRESLFLGIPTLASDVAPRPETTAIFESRNLQDFVSKAQLLLSENRRSHTAKASADAFEHVEAYLDLLTRLGKP